MTNDIATRAHGRSAAKDTDPIGVLGRCRGHALSAGSMAMIAATADDSEERRAALDEYARCVRLYREGIADGLTADVRTSLANGATGMIAALEAFGAMLPKADEAGFPNRKDAVEVAWASRRDVMPALYGALDILMEREAISEKTAVARIAERNRRLETMFTEMERIGRAIRLISLNAAVEASRAGGASGRAFSVIATEVRGLATRASEILAQTRADMADRRGEP